MLDHMLGDLDGRRGWQLDHLPTAGHTDPSQSTATHRTRAEVVLDNARRLLPTPGAIILRVALLAQRLFSILRLLHSGLHKGRWRRLVLLQLLDAFLRYGQLLLRLAQLFLGQPQLFKHLAQLCF